VFTDGDVVNKRKLILIIFLILSIVITGTLAYFSVVTERSALVLVLGEQDEVLVTLEPFEIKGTLMSVTNYTSFETNSIEDDYIQMTAENFSSVPKKVIFYYRINDIDDSLVSTSLKYTITSSSEINGTYTEVTTGNFSSAASGFDMAIYEIDIPANSTIFYRVFTYLDGNTNVSGMAGALIDAEFRAEMDYVISPDLDNGMIPVTLNYSGSTLTVKTVYSSDENWFDYENHKWANVVLVKENNRANYIGTSGVTINQSDILAYYVWIPRFEYRHDNLGTSYAGGSQNSPGAIAINFIPSYITLPTSSSYKVHPAFTFGDTELSGFWVGKFETTGTKDQPTVLPQNVALNNINQRTMFETSLKFNGGGLNNGNVTFAGSNYYGTSNQFDSHMMKNSEWGALNYLTQSLYGRCTDETTCQVLGANNSSSYYTGSSHNAISTGSTISTSISANGTEQWPTYGQTASTTNGNPTNWRYGVFDTSSGVWESMMSVLQYDSNFIYSGSTSGAIGANSTFAGYIGDILYDTSAYAKMPPAKYYDRYTSTNPETACNGSVCYGHALSETLGWYSHASSPFVTASTPWSMFGGGVSTSNKGNFSIGNSTGGAVAGVGFRSVIVNAASPGDGSSGSNIPSASDGALMLINKANAANIMTYSSGNTGEMYTFSQPATAQTAATTDYRYIGDSPNNYITFNNETWRIIGVFDGKIKIIRDERIMNTDIRWDYKKTGIGSSTSDYGSNDWVDAQLMYMLNDNDIATHVAKKTDYTYDGTNVYDASDNIIYQKGCKPVAVDGTVTYSCTANTWSLNSTALSQVEDTIYYLGGTSSISGKSATDYYTFERGETKYNDVRSTNWTGKVGLIYPSDYAYTFAYGVDDTCYSNAHSCNNSTPTSSWLYKSSYIQWTLAPLNGGAGYVFRVGSAGSVNDVNAYYAYGVRPVVYLRSDITLTGSGTVDDKYEIVEPITGSTMLINKANAANVTTYSSGNTKEMYTFSQPATTQVAATTDYRYIGNNPNNYITFNNETWRIIGVFDGKIKIIRDERILNGNISWDYKKTGIGSSTTDYGSNDWVDSQLMYMLNDNDIATHVAKKTNYTFDGTNVKDASGNIIYQKGCRPAAVDGTVTYSCTANAWSLNSTALSQIEDTIYYLGGTSSISGKSAIDYYTFERGTLKFNDTRSTNWTGKVGLMYPSDYAYTFAYGVDDTCYSNTYTCNNSTPSSSWLYNSTHSQWLLAPNSSSAGSVFYVASAGRVHYGSAINTNGVRPVVYLKSNIELTGSGTSGDMYQIVS